MVIKKRGKLPRGRSRRFGEDWRIWELPKLLKYLTYKPNQQFSLFTKTCQLIFPTVSCLKILPEGRYYLIFIYISLSFHLYMGLFLGPAYIFCWSVNISIVLSVPNVDYTFLKWEPLILIFLLSDSFWRFLFQMYCRLNLAISKYQW